VGYLLSGQLRPAPRPCASKMPRMTTRPRKRSRSPTYCCRSREKMPSQPTAHAATKSARPLPNRTRTPLPAGSSSTPSAATPHTSSASGSASAAASSAARSAVREICKLCPPVARHSSAAATCPRPTTTSAAPACKARPDQRLFDRDPGMGIRKDWSCDLAGGECGPPEGHGTPSFVEDEVTR
jgi:hypothetical protein